MLTQKAVPAVVFEGSAIASDDEENHAMKGFTEIGDFKVMLLTHVSVCATSLFVLQALMILQLQGSCQKRVDHACFGIGFQS